MSKSPSLRRIQADIRELALDPSDRYHAAPLEDDMFEWHFTIRGADGTDFEGGVYHGRILLPPEYPFKPPNIVFLTPSGRFETGTKVCLSFSAYHPELWQPAWGIRLILEALISFLPTPADGAIGALDWSSVERKRLATKSIDYCCPRCGKAVSLLPKLGSSSASSGAKSTTASSRFQKEIERLHQLQWEHEGKKNAEILATADTAAPANENKSSGDKKSEKEITTEGGVDENLNATTTRKDGNNENDEAKAPATLTATSTSDLTADEESNNDSSASTEKKSVPGTNAGNQNVVPQVSSEHATPHEPKGTTVALPVAEGAAQPTSAAAANTVAAPAVSLDAPDAEADAVALHANSDPYWLIDPVLQCTVVLLAIICYLLIRKGYALYDEIRRMDAN